MQRLGDALVFSATDLNNALACAHLTTLDLAALDGRAIKPAARSEQAALLAELGEQHEQRYLAELRAQGLQIETIERERDYAAAAAATEDAMSRGVAVIYQATFYDGTWLGHADFLRRVDSPLPGSRWAWHYEVEDTKLARHTQPYFLLQLCYYSEHVARIQGATPQRMYVVLGDGSPPQAFRVDDFSAYYRSVKARFIERLHDESVATYPVPNPHCALCAWNPVCEARRSADDHLSGVAGITRLQTARLTDAGIPTLRDLARHDPQAVPAEVARDTFVKLRRQASLQYDQREAFARGDPHPYRYELLAEGVAPQRGLSLLPEPSPGDVFFDMEGDPYYEIGTGLEYLFGAVTADDRQFHAFWGCDRTGAPVSDRAAERRAFGQFVDFISERRRRFPALHVYHYAAYEKTALQKLALRHGTHEEDVDVLLREQVLVDLYAVVRQAVVVGQPSYSIKKIEEYYGKRGGASAIGGGADSILCFEEWLTTRRDANTRNDAILSDLEQYNRYDCESTLGLRDWLLELRREAERTFATRIPWFAGALPDGAPKRELPHAALCERLEERVPADCDPADRSDPRSAQVRPYFLLRHMLEYHWREDKPVWWQFHDRCATFHDDPALLQDDTETIVGLVPVGRPRQEKLSLAHTLHFPPQVHKIGRDKCFDPATKGKAGEILHIEDDETGGRLELKRGPSLADVPLPTALTVRNIVPAGAVLEALARFAEAVLETNLPVRYRAAHDVLTGAVSRLRDRVAGDRIQPQHVDEASVAELVAALDESYLFVQGPPGAGKTWLAARLIVGLIGRGRRVGVTANTHKAIHNLLAAVEAVARERGVTIVGAKQSGDDPEHFYVSPAFVNVTKLSSVAGMNLGAGTAWAFATAAMDRSLDYLFIDEAGQMALPVALAALTAAKNAVLLGDPLQLAQVSHANHPGDIGCSVLRHLLGGELRPVAADRGVLLTDSYRMHPDVCDFISTMMYEGKLHAAPGRERQQVNSSGLRGAGLRHLPVSHAGNAQSSREEARAIADEIDRLLTGTVTDWKGVIRVLTPPDIIVVAPYNVQVRVIRRELQNRGGPAALVEVATVDKFQGREADVVFFSTAASSPEDAPRGTRFIFDRQRFNVAVSRARAMAVLVGSPSLLRIVCSSIEDVRLANAVCRFVELATPVRAAG